MMKIKRIDLPWLTTVALFASIYISRMNAYGSLVLIGFTLLMLLITAIKRKGDLRIEVSYFHCHLFLFGLFALLSSLWALNSHDSLSKALTLFEILICMSVFYGYYSHDVNGVEKLLKAVMWAGYVVTIYSILDYGVVTVFTQLTSGGRLESTFNNVNEIAGLCAISIVLTIYFWFNKGFFLYHFFAIPAFILLLACESKRAIISLAICLLLLLFFRFFSKTDKKAKKKIFLFGTLFIAVTIILLKTPIFSGLAERMGYFVSSFTGSGDVDHSTEIRKQLVGFGLSIFKKNPILGIGIGNTHILVNQYYGEDFYLHNNFVELLAGGGIIGFAIYYSMFAFVLFSIFKHGGIHCSRNRIILVLLSFLLIADLASGTYYAKETYFFLMICSLHASSIKGTYPLTNNNRVNNFMSETADWRIAK